MGKVPYSLSRRRRDGLHQHDLALSSHPDERHPADGGTGQLESWRACIPGPGLPRQVKRGAWMTAKYKGEKGK